MQVTAWKSHRLYYKKGITHQNRKQKIRKKEDCPGTKTQPETKNHVSDEDSARRDRRRS